MSFTLAIVDVEKILGPMLGFIIAIGDEGVATGSGI